MFEHHKRHKRGWKTMLFLFFKHGWLLMIIGIATLTLSWLLYYGPAYQFMDTFFNNHPDWYITAGMFASWIMMIGIAIIIFAYMNALMHYQHYKFILDENAFHLHRGLFFIRETTIPYHQISNVHIARPYHYRIFGVSELDIVTAADKSLSHVENRKTKEFLIPVIDASVARLLADQLVTYASRRKRGESLVIEEGEVDDETSDSLDIDDTNDVEGVEGVEDVEKEEVENSTDDTIEDIRVDDSPAKRITIEKKIAVDDIGEIEDIRDLEKF